ncbi:DUF1549 domain-containing protein, partial [Akkermansiaceae bacterium]|nr:DUF1549 domain-containing protein [Akkermansiaceae bacterium]
VNTTMATWMGTTAACAQCHTHKYDPISHAEYFQMFAIFNQSEDADRRNEAPIIQVMGDRNKKKAAHISAEIAKLKKEMEPANKLDPKAVAEWEAALKAQEGKLLWKQKLGREHSASLVVFRDHVVFGSEKGLITVVKPGPEFQEVAKMKLSEPLWASPVITDGYWFLRGEEHLFCIGKGN